MISKPLRFILIIATVIVVIGVLMLIVAASRIQLATESISSIEYVRNDNGGIKHVPVVLSEGDRNRVLSIVGHAHALPWPSSPGGLHGWLVIRYENGDIVELLLCGEDMIRQVGDERFYWTGDSLHETLMKIPPSPVSSTKPQLPLTESQIIEMRKQRSGMAGTPPRR